MQVGELTLAVSRLGNEKVALEQSMEMEEEGIVNRLQRVIESVMARNKAGPPGPPHPTQPLPSPHLHLACISRLYFCCAWERLDRSEYLLLCSACMSGGQAGHRPLQLRRNSEAGGMACRCWRRVWSRTA